MINRSSHFFYEKEYEIRYSDLDYNRVLKPSALLNYLQDLATVAADSAGFGYEFVSSKNYAWFLLKYRMEFIDYPEKMDKLKIMTEARGITRLFANRDFEIYSENGKLLGRVASLWAIVDLTNKSMVNISSLIKTMPLMEKREDDLTFSKIKPLDNINFEKIFQIRFDDIDVNYHVNNVNYIIWALEALPYDFKGKHKLKTLDMFYKKEIQFGHNILSQAQLDETTMESNHIVRNKTTNEDLCLIKTTYEKFN